jgi:hypothetical protein
VTRRCRPAKAAVGCGPHGACERSHLSCACSRRCSSVLAFATRVAALASLSLGVGWRAAATSA